VLKCAGIDVRYITGNTGLTGEDHAWNQVKIDGIWYNCDLTWDRDNFYRYIDAHSNERTWRKEDKPLEFCLEGKDNEEFKSRTVDSICIQGDVCEHQYDRKIFEETKNRVIESLSGKDYKLRFPRVKERKNRVLLLKKGVTFEEYIEYRMARDNATTEEEKEILWEKFCALQIKNREEARIQAREGDVIRT